jgi:hypothetical protein
MGWQAWDVTTRCAGQLRLAPSIAIGIDMAAAMTMGAALGHDAYALAELLPAAEAGMITAFNNRLTETSP